jgi:hypothetical protein
VLASKLQNLGPVFVSNACHQHALRFLYGSASPSTKGQEAAFCTLSFPESLRIEKKYVVEAAEVTLIIRGIRYRTLWDYGRLPPVKLRLSPKQGITSF